MPTAAPSAQRLFRTLCYASLIVAAGCSDQSEPLAPRMTVTPHAVVTPDIVVTSTADNGPGTLRDAVLNATPGQVIGFDASIAGQSITLSSFIGVHLGAVLTIDGGPAGMTISGGSATQIFIVQFNSTVTLRNLTLENAATSTGGGAVVNAGTLTIENSTLRNNFALAGGGGAVQCQHHRQCEVGQYHAFRKLRVLRRDIQHTRCPARVDQHNRQRQYLAVFGIQFAADGRRPDGAGKQHPDGGA